MWKYAFVTISVCTCFMLVFVLIASVREICFAFIEDLLFLDLRGLYISSLQFIVAMSEKLY